MKYDYVIVGSGLAGLTFGALMAKFGRHVLLLEAHEFPGGYGHTFELVVIDLMHNFIMFGIVEKDELFTVCSKSLIYIKL